MSFTRTSILIALTGISGLPAGAVKPESLKRMNILFVFADDWGRYATIKKKLAGRLMQELTRAGDPRVAENPPRFEMPPFTLP